MNKKRNRPTGTMQDDDYVNTQNWHPFHQTYPEMSDSTEFLNNKKTGKFVISALIIHLMLGALSTICVVGILYYNKVVSYELLSEQYTNVTATLVMKGNKANETQKLYEELKGSCQQVREDLSACNAQQNSQQSSGEWKTLGLNSYYFTAFKLNWAQCRDYCVEKGGHLVIINSQTEQDVVSSQIGETHWIGLNDLETEGEWMWINNQSLKKTGVMFWYDAPEGPHEPDNWKVQDSSGEDCAALGDANDHNKVVSYEICEQYASVTATLMMRINKGQSAEENIYENMQDWHAKNKTSPEISDNIEFLSNKKTAKIFISALIILLILGSLSTLCVVAILYYNKVVSYEILSEQYANVTATLMIKENKAKETQNLYEELKGNCQQVQKTLSACNAKQNSRQSEGEWKTLGLKSYYFSAFKHNWTQSRDYCVGKGGHLVIINSQTEQDLVSSQIGETHWIGLNDLETEGEWIWVNNQPLKKTSVTFWYDAPEGPHEPDNWKVQDSSGENCVALGDGNGNTHKWFDASCRKLKKCICEK